ncbi:hypothetical protein [Shewanella woodyi]|uniref:hypothetical protein n=1 Tax=Shewanella woodyi TaxID=60961 RepID=UPI0012FCC973|nr:hypothetical protein [Shewanella woodyi]
MDIVASTIPVVSTMTSDVNGFTNDVVTGCHRTAMPSTPTAASTPECLSLRFRLIGYDPFIAAAISQCHLSE